MNDLISCCWSWQFESMLRLITISRVDVPFCGGSWPNGAMTVLRHVVLLQRRSIDLPCVLGLMNREDNDSNSPCSNQFPLIRSIFQVLVNFITSLLVKWWAKFPLSTIVFTDKYEMSDEWKRNSWFSKTFKWVVIVNEKFQ